MTKRFSLTALALSLLVQPAWAVSNLSVVFVDPEKYSDASYSSSFSSATDRADVQQEIEAHLGRLSERYLAPRDSLKIEVLDIDLAGRIEPLRARTGGGDMRVVRDISWPRMTLVYTLTRAQQFTARREEVLSDPNFLTSFNRYSSGDRLRYEKAMLDRWFKESFSTK